jgi:hypothetical protein
MGIAQGLNAVHVPVVHSVQLKDFTAWLDRTGGSPKDVSKHNRIKDILGLASGVKR